VVINIFIIWIILMLLDITLTFYTFFITNNIGVLDYDNEIGILAKRLFKWFGHSPIAYLIICAIMTLIYMFVVYLCSFISVAVIFYLFLIQAGSYIVIFQLHISNIRYYKKIYVNRQKHISTV
jgi:hypothetical protein